MNYFFLLLCIATNLFSSLPLELQEKISHFVYPQEGPSVIPLKKHIDNYEGLVFPQTGSFVFVKLMSSQSEDFEYLRSLKKDTKVLPNIQLWFNHNQFRIDDDLKKVQNNFENSRQITQRSLVFFDKNDTYVLLATQREDDFKISIRPLMNAESIIINQHFCKSFYSPCLHHDADAIEYSFFGKENDDSVYLYRRKFIYKFFKKFYTVNETKIPVDPSFSHVKKHEYIGKDTFIFLMNNELFFMVDGEELPFKKQSFSYFLTLEKDGSTDSDLNTKKIKFEYNVISFAACQEERTPNGRARFIAVLVTGNLEKKVLLIDVLDPYSTAHLIYSCNKYLPYDRISFFGNVISLWVDDPEILEALEIRLPDTYINGCKKSQLCLDAFQKRSYQDNITSFEDLKKIGSETQDNQNNAYVNKLVSKSKYISSVELFSKAGFLKSFKFFSFGVLFICASIAVMMKAKTLFLR